MQEIEVKARLQNKEKAMDKLRALACVFDEPITQEDTVYAENIGTMDVFLANKVFLRIRVVNGSRVIFTTKKRTGPLVAIEHEVEVNSKSELEAMIALMGFKQSTKINKTRIITHHNGCEICIDDVEGLGAFIEMEKLSENGSPEEIQKELFEFLMTLGISAEDRVTKGYDLLVLEKN